MFDILKKNKKMVIIIIIGIIFSTIAFAQTTYNLTASGSMALALQDGVIITNVEYVSGQSSNGTATVNRYVNTMLTNTINLDNDSSYATIKVTVKNTDNVKHRFSGVLYDDTANPELGSYSNADIVPSIINYNNSLQANDTINEQETKDIYIKYSFRNTGHSAETLVGTVNISFIRLYNITYVLNGGTQANNQVVTFAEGETINILSPTKSDADFMGWYLNSNFTGQTQQQIVGGTEDITLYAKFYDYYYLYFQMPPDWYKNEQDVDYNVYIYLFDKDNTSIKNANWPGVLTERFSSSPKSDIFRYRAREDYFDQFNSVIFTNGFSAGGVVNTVDAEKTYKQTVDVTLSQSSYGKIFVPELYSSNNTNEKRIFARSGFNFHYYILNDSTGAKPTGGDWPGTLFVNRVSGDSPLYAVVNKSNYDKMIINRGLNTSQTQTFNVIDEQDLTISYSYNYNYYFVTRCYYDGSWHNYNSWISSEYDTWHSGDYTVFSNTTNAINAINYYLN